MKILKWVGIAIGALFLVVLGMTIASPDEEGRGVSEASASATETPSEVATPEPTVEPTPEPTEAPTPKPTPEPTPEPTLDSGFSEWITYSLDRLTWMENDFIPANSGWDTSGNDPYMMALGAMPLWTATLGEQSSLAFIEPDPCFAEWHTNWAAVVDKLHDGYDVITDGGIESDMSKIESGIATIDVGLELMNESTAAIAATAEACGG